MRQLLALPSFPALLLATLLMGLRDSMTMPYLTLFAVDGAGLKPLALGVLLTVRAAGAVAFSMLFGAWFDRRPGVLPMLVALGAGVIGYALLSTTTDFLLLLAICGLPLGIGSAAFPLLFALAKNLGGGAEPVTGERGIAVLRASFSAAWGVGPAVGAGLVGTTGYDGLFWVSAAFSLLALLPFAVARMPMRAWPGASAGAAAVRRLSPAAVLAAASLTLFSMAVSMGAVALPITITVDLLSDKSQVGVAYSVCAFLEVPVMIAIAARPLFFLGYGSMAAGFVALAVYFAIVALVPTVGGVIAAQAIRALAIGLVSCIGISYLQNLMPGRVGAAAALYANTGQVGSLLAGVAAGAWANSFGYHALFWLCAGASLAGLGFLALGRRA